MNKKQLLILLAVPAIIIALSTFVTATNLEDINFNISSEFKPIEDASGLQYIDESNGVRIRIFDDDKDWESGAEKYNETVYIFNSSNGGDDIVVKDEVIGQMPVTIIFSYGEYIKIDGKQYWVEFNNEDYENPNYDKILESLEYFNEHNHFESVPT